MTDDAELLRRYAADRSEEAFAEFVRRHLDLVYAAALRRLGGDAHRAADAAQQVFVTVAQRAAELAGHPNPAAWLHAATRNAAINMIRDAQLRQEREHAAQAEQQALGADAPPADWSRLRPVLDDAMDELDERDREAVLLRYFEGRAFAEVGARLRLTENAARMRVERALDKLHALLARRGVASTSAALALALVSEAAPAAPAGLAAAVSGAALAATPIGAAAAATTAHWLTFMSTTKLALGVAGLAAIAATAVTWHERQTSAELRHAIATLEARAVEADTLRTEKAQAATAQAAAAAQARADHAELVQLRAEKAAYLQAAAARKAAAARRPETSVAPATDGLAPGMVAVDKFRDVGRATPSAAAQTMMAAAQRGDIKTAATALTFDPAERAKMEAFIATLPENVRAEYRTPEEMIAFVIAGSPRPIAGAQLLSETHPTDDTVVQRVQIQYQSGEVRQDELRFRHNEDGWQQVVSPTLVDHVITYFKGQP